MASAPHYNAMPPGSAPPVIVQGQYVQRPSSQSQYPQQQGTYGYQQQQPQQGFAHALDQPQSGNYNQYQQQQQQYGGVAPVKPMTQASTYNHSSNSNPQDAKPANTNENHPCRDVFWAILFYVHLAGMAYLTATYTPAFIADVAENVEQGGNGGRRSLLQAKEQLTARFLDDAAQKNQELEIDPSALLTVLCLSSAVAFAVSSFALGFMISFAEALIKMALIFNIVLFGLLGLVSLLGGAMGGALMCFLMSAFSAYYAYRVWSRIPFAASNLVTAVTAVRSNLGLAFYAYSSLLLLFGWSIFWSVGTLSTIYVVSGCSVADEQCESEINGGIMFLFLVSYYWTMQVISNVVHVTTSGTVGTWWMVPHEANGCCSKAVRDSYVRSITTSFGSICFGSLLVALIQAVKEMIPSARENGDSVIACCAECLIGCLERLMEYFNKWAFVYVGIYGFSFMEAGSSVMTLFRERGWTSIITDYMVDTVLFMVSVGVAVLTGLLAVAIGAAMHLSDSANLGLSFLIGFMVGFGMCTTLFSVVSSAVNTVIVCYAEAPNEFQTNHPDLSERMLAAWRTAWPTEFSY